MSFLKKKKTGRKSIEQNQRSFNDAVITLGKNLEEEKKRGKLYISIQRVNQRICYYLNLSSSYVKKIRANNEQSKDLKIGKEKLRKYEIDGFDVQTIRKMIHDHIKNHEHFTLRSLVWELKYSELQYEMSKSTLALVLNEIGFKFYRNGLKQYPSEDPSIVFIRHKYIQTIRQLRSERFNVVYLDETWINAGHVCVSQWAEGGLKNPCKDCRRKLPNGKGKKKVFQKWNSKKKVFKISSNRPKTNHTGCRR